MRIEVKDNYGRIHFINPEYIIDILESEAIKEGCIVELFGGKQVILKIPIQEANSLLRPQISKTR